MIKLRLFWIWPVIIIWDHAKYHASKNPAKRKAPENRIGPPEDVLKSETYPPAGE